MKKIFTLLFLIGVLSIANAQSTAAIIDSTVCYSFSSPTDSIPITLTINHYDANDNQILIVSYNWDSIYNDFIGYTKYDWIGNEKKEVEYNSNDNKVLSVSYDWDKNINNWVSYKKEEYKYDSNNNLLLKSDLYGNIKTESTYDANNNLIYIKNYIFFNNFSWQQIPPYYVYEYDTNSNQILYIHFWNEDGDKKTESTYDANNNLILSKFYIMTPTMVDWSLYSKTENIYDTANNRTIEILYIWNESLNDWDFSSKHEYFYDANNNKTLDMYYKWDSNINDWDINKKQEYTYNSNNIKILHIYYDWDSNINDWFGYKKEEYTYDANNNQILYIHYKLRGAILDFYTKIEASYDANNNLTMYAHYTWYDNNWGMQNYKLDYKLEYTYDSNNNITKEEYYSWDNNINDWVIYHKCNDLYSAISEQTTQEIRIFPNPTTGRVLIDNNNNVEKVEVYNISGKLILTTDKKEIDLSNNAKGTYLFRVTIDNSIYTKKIILE